MSEVLHRLATKEAVDALTAAVEALPNATQEAADNANDAAEEAIAAAANIKDAKGAASATDAMAYLLGKEIPQYILDIMTKAGGTLVEGRAWKRDGTETAGSEYCYKTYSGITSGYYNNYMIITGASWGEDWPLVCFYNSSNELITYCQTTGNTFYTNIMISIPVGTDHFVVNGRNESGGLPVVSYYVKSEIAGMLQGLNSFVGTLNSTYLEYEPTYTNVRNLPANYIYRLGASYYRSMEDAPDGFNTYGTLVKMNGGGSRSDNGGYCSYLLFSPVKVWAAFDDGESSSLNWLQIYPASGSGSTRARRVLIIGDSYCEGYSHDGNNSGWGNYLVEAMGLSSGYYTITYSGGCCFGNSSNNFISLLNNAASMDYTDIIVAGGFNDNSETEANIISGLSAFCARAKTLYPTAKVWVGCVGNIKAGSGSSAYSNWQEIKGYIKGKVLGVYQTAPKYGAAYTNFAEYLLTDDGLTPTDGYHPNADGNKAIAKGLANAIMSGTCCLPNGVFA